MVKPRSVSLRGHRVGRAVENAIADATSAVVCTGSFDYLVKGLPAFAEANFDTYFLSVTAHPQPQVLAGFLLRGPALGAARDLDGIPAKDLIAHLQPAAFGGTPGFDGSDRPRRIGLALDRKAKRGTRTFLFLDRQTRSGKELCIRQGLRTADIIVEEIVQGAAGELFRGEADVQAVTIEFAGSGEVLIHVAEHVVQAVLIVGAVADKDIEKDAEDLALGVIGDTALRLVVKGIFLEPGVETGLLGALPTLGRARLEFRDLRTQVLIKLLMIPDAGANQSVRTVRVRDALGKPKCACVHLVGVIHRLQRGGTNALDVPQMEKFVGRDVAEIFAGRYVDGRGIGVLHTASAASSGLAEVKEEGVVGVGSAFHHSGFVEYDFAKRGFDFVAFVILAVDQELFEMRRFNGTIGKSVEGWGFEPSDTVRSRLNY